MTCLFIYSQNAAGLSHTKIICSFVKRSALLHLVIVVISGLHCVRIYISVRSFIERFFSEISSISHSVKPKRVRRDSLRGLRKFSLFSIFSINTFSSGESDSFFIYSANSPIFCVPLWILIILPIKPMLIHCHFSESTSLFSNHSIAPSFQSERNILLGSSLIFVRSIPLILSVSSSILSCHSRL